MEWSTNSIYNRDAVEASFALFVCLFAYGFSLRHPIALDGAYRKDFQRGGESSRVYLRYLWLLNHEFTFIRDFVVPPRLRRCNYYK